MPRFPIIDTHVHFYDPARIAYPWLADQPAIDAAFLPAGLDAARGSVAIEQCVAVEVDAAPGREHEEALFLDGLALAEPRIGAIVASAPVETGEAVATDLERLRALPRVRSIRRLIQSLPRPDACLEPAFVAGVRMVGRFGLPFELCIRHGQLASATALVRLCPDVSFILDHLAKPPIATGGAEAWRREMTALAALPNVVAKVSGLVTEADPAAWTRDDLLPYVDHAIACFGFDRVMFGSDWPVLTLASTYARWIEVLDDGLSGVADEDLRRLYRDTATQVYGFGA